jgi:hypothetical protein
MASRMTKLPHPYKAKVYRIPKPGSPMRPKTASEEIADIDAGLRPPVQEPPAQPETVWQGIKRRWSDWLYSTKF